MLNSAINQLVFLGQVPGTDFQITFTELLLAAELALVIFLFRKKPLLVKVGRRLKFYLLKLEVYLLTDKGKELRLPV